MLSVILHTDAVQTNNPTGRKRGIQYVCTRLVSYMTDDIQK